MFDFLIQEGASLKKSGPLHAIARNIFLPPANESQSLAMMRHIIRKGKGIEALEFENNAAFLAEYPIFQRKIHRTTFQRAILRGRVKAADLLLRAKSDPWKKDSGKQGKTAIRYPSEGQAENEDSEAVAALLEQKVLHQLQILQKLVSQTESHNLLAQSREG